MTPIGIHMANARVSIKRRSLFGSVVRYVLVFVLGLVSAFVLAWWWAGSVDREPSRHQSIVQIVPSDSQHGGSHHDRAR